MSKSIKPLHESPRHDPVLRRTADQATKIRTHRHERRKLRCLIRLGEWDEADEV